MAKPAKKMDEENTQTETAETTEAKPKWPTIKYRLSQLYWISNAVIFNQQDGNKLDGDKNGLYDWTGKERYKVSKFTQWLNAEVTAAETVKNTLLKKKDEVLVDKEGPSKWDSYVNETEVEYTGPIIEANEDFFGRVRLGVDVLFRLGDFIKVVD